MSESNATEIVWEAPPNHGNAGTPKYQELAAALRARPGEWAVLERAASPGISSMIASARYLAFRPKGAFQGRQVSVGGGKADIYVRFIGEPEGGEL